jgi:hypothetical protein
VTAGLVVVETQDFASAARRLRRWVAEPIEWRTTALSRALEGCAGMAGSDSGGMAWAASYDRAAGRAVQAAADAAIALDNLATMFAQTARNYAAAELASTPAERGLLDAAVDDLPRVTHMYGLPVCVPPPARGGSGGDPSGWGLISHLVGYVWPNGHQDRLRAAAAAWSSSAAALRSGADETVSAAGLAIDDRLPEAGDIWQVCQSTAARLGALSEVHKSLADSCEGLAQHLDEVHSAIEGELASLVAWTAGIEITGGLLSFITFGLAEAPTQAVEAARVGATAARVAGLIERFTAVTRTLAAPLASAADRAAEASARLRVLVNARLTEAAVNTVRHYRMLRFADESGAIGRLGGEAAKNVRLFATRAEARQGLEGPLRSKCNQFFKDATSKSRDFRITELPNGNYRLEHFAPANNPGYGKLYVQILGPRGQNIEKYRDTLGPNGLIERKWTPTKAMP